MSPNGDMKPSASELIILKHLWKHQPQSLREIHQAIAPKLSWSRSSTRTTVDRMVGKSMLLIEDSHGLKIYSAKLKKIPTIAALIRQFTEDVLGIDAPLPVSNLVDSNLLDASELADLEAHLEKLSQIKSKERNND